MRIRNQEGVGGGVQVQELLFLNLFSGYLIDRGSGDSDGFQVEFVRHVVEAAHSLQNVH